MSGSPIVSGLAASARAACLAVLFASCRSDSGPAAPPVVRGPSVTLLSPEVHVTDGLRAVSNVIVLEVRDSAGRPLAGVRTFPTETTGWLKFGGGSWTRERYHVYTDSSGRVSFAWQPSGTGDQRFGFIWDGGPSFERRFVLARPAVPFMADSVVPSGSEAVCVQRDGRIGCLGLNACRSCGDGTFGDRALDSLHWFALTAPPKSLTSTVGGACALLMDGNTACWDGIGPDGVARNDVGHPPFVEFTGSIGRTADGVVWKGVISGESGYAELAPYRVWNRIPSDSVIAGLLTDFDETAMCGFTASSAVMCSLANRDVIQPYVIMQPFRLLRSLPDSAVVRARAGYTSPRYGDLISTSVVTWTTAGTALRFDSPSISPGGWFATPAADTTLSGPDVHVRTCVAALDSTCDTARPWRQVYIAGRLGPYGNGGQRRLGYSRICGVREVLVCALSIRRPGGQGAFPVSIDVVDTVRVAP